MTERIERDVRMDDLQDRPHHIMLSEAKHLRQPITVNPMIGCFASLSMTRQGTILMACHKKGPRTCHAERQRSIWSHQLGGVAHLGLFAALRMTCRGHFVMACRMLAPRHRSTAQATRQGWPYERRPLHKRHEPPVL